MLVSTVLFVACTCAVHPVTMTTGLVHVLDLAETLASMCQSFVSRHLSVMAVLIFVSVNSRCSVHLKVRCMRIQGTVNEYGLQEAALHA